MRVEPERRGNAFITRFASESEPGEIIPAIASFDEQGKVRPLYLRINGESMKVLECCEISNAHDKIAEYRCVIADSGFKKNIRLKYCYAEAKWVLPDRK